MHGSKHCISAACYHSASATSWTVLGVYGPQTPPAKLQFLAELQVVANTCVGPMLILGDFNLIAAADEKSNGNINTGLINAFRNFINTLDLKDMYLLGRRYTWSNE